MSQFRMPAEWFAHDATWIAWPHYEPDWPGKLEPIPWVYAEIVRILTQGERVEILCQNEEIRAQAERCLQAHHVEMSQCRFHLVPNDRSWLRDSAPTAVHNADGQTEWVGWKFNGWAKYDNHKRDELVAETVAQLSGKVMHRPTQPNSSDVIVLEGGAFDTDGMGTLLVTEECLLSDQQVRNPGLGRSDYEELFSKYLGIRQTIWLGNGVVGDDTHGHVDDIARFVSPHTVVLAYEPDPHDPNHEASLDNALRLQKAVDATDSRLRVVTLPMPAPVMYGDERLPASYANFYIANRHVLVPTFNDPNDRIALNTLAGLFPDRTVVGIHALDLVLGNGTLHCLTQQQPVDRRD